MTSRKKWIAGSLFVASALYKVAQGMQFMSPVVTWLNKRMGSDSVVELLLFGIIVYLFLEGDTTSKEPTQVTASVPALVPAVKETTPPPIPVRRKTPNVLAKRGRITWLDNVNDVLWEPEIKGKWKAVIAEFRNEPGEFSLFAWHDVHASITYFDGQGSEIAHVGRALWLEVLGTKLEFPNQVTRKLVVAVQGADSIVGFDDDGAVPLSADIRRAKIILHDPREFSFSYLLDFDFDAGTVGSFVPLSPSK